MNGEHFFPANPMEDPFMDEYDADPATQGHRGSSPNRENDYELNPYSLRLGSPMSDGDSEKTGPSVAGLDGDLSDHASSSLSRTGHYNYPIHDEVALVKDAAGTLVQMGSSSRWEAPQATISPEAVRPRFTQGEAVHMGISNYTTSLPSHFHSYGEASSAVFPQAAYPLPQSALRSGGGVDNEAGNEIDDVDNSLEDARAAPTPQGSECSYATDATWASPAGHKTFTIPEGLSEPPSPAPTSYAPSVGVVDSDFLHPDDVNFVSGFAAESPEEVLRELTDTIDEPESAPGSERDGDYEEYDGDYVEAFGDVDEDDDDYDAVPDVPKKRSGAKGKQRQQHRRRFKIALWETINDAKFHEFIHWSTDGTEGVIPDINKFAEGEGNTHSVKELQLMAAMSEITGAHRFDSFKRQLHMWGFKREHKGAKSCIFIHELFQRDRPDLLEEIERRVEAKSRVNPTPKTRATPKPKGTRAPKNGRKSARRTRASSLASTLADISGNVNNDAAPSSSTRSNATSSSQASVPAPSSPTLGIAANKKRRAKMLPSSAPKTKVAKKAAPATPKTPKRTYIVEVPGAPKKRRRTEP